MLEGHYPGVFYGSHPDFNRAQLKITVREGKPTEAFHAADWFHTDAYEGPTTFEYPAEWGPFVGYYHIYSPWMNDFRVYVRKGQLYQQWWGMFERPLTPLEDGSFRPGEAPSPERLGFDCILADQATRATLSGAEYYRIESP